MEYLILIKCLETGEAEVLTDDNGKSKVFTCLKDAQETVESMNNYYANGKAFARAVAVQPLNQREERSDESAACTEFKLTTGKLESN